MKTGYRDQLVTFETAKLANSKGFEPINIGLGVITDNYFVLSTGELNGSRLYTKEMRMKLKNEGKTDPSDFFEVLISAPTQSQLGTWLRKTHGIHVEPTFKSWEDDTYSFDILIKGQPDFDYNSVVHNTSDSSYESALENGLNWSLYYIKN